MTPEKAFDVAVADLVRDARAIGHTVPCKRGCSNCCYDIAIVTHLEMPPIIERLRKMGPLELHFIALAIDEWFGRAKAGGVNPFNSEPQVKTYFQAKLACPLLNRASGECRIYDERPVACRGHYVVDETPDACAERAIRPHIQMLNVQSALHPYFGALVEEAIKQAKAPKELRVVTAMLPTMLNNIFRTLLPQPGKSVDEWVSDIQK
jgi:Fe-S-cluster containining protein